MTTLGKKLIYVAALALLISACKTAARKSNKPGQDVAPLAIVTFDENPFKNAQTATAIKESLQSLVANNVDKEKLWATAHCQCSPNFAGAYLANVAVTNGALPQPLVPSVREQIRNDPKLRILLSLPAGALQNAANFLAGLFINDQKIAEQIRLGVAEKINRATPGGSRIETHLKFRFDGFPSATGLNSGAAIAPPKIVDIDTQASRWAMIMLLPNMWKAEAPVAFGDHGLQLLQTAQMMAEWQYMFGLEKAANGTIYGGMTFDPLQGTGSKLAPFDPRVDSKGRRVVSGTYSISYQNADQIDLATNVQEKWQHMAAKINLDEQARLWTSAAAAFNRLRPKNRGNVASVFGANGMFPQDAHQLGLIFLPGIEVLLDGLMIDKEALLVRQYAATSDVTGPEKVQPANLLTLARLARAMNLWVEETRDLGDAGLDSATKSKLANANGEFTKVVQLAIQSILANHVRDAGVKNKLNSIAMIRSPQDYSRPDAAEVAEVLATLTAVEQGAMPSPILKQRIVGLYHWFAAEYLADLGKSGKVATMSPQAILWTYKAMQLFGRYTRSEHKAIWLKDLSAQLKTAIDSWDKGVAK